MKEQIEFLEKLQETSKFYDFWSEVRSNRPVDIMVPPGMDKQLETELQEKGIQWSVMIKDVQENINMEKFHQKDKKNQILNTQ